MSSGVKDDEGNGNDKAAAVAPVAAPVVAPVAATVAAPVAAPVAATVAAPVAAPKAENDEAGRVGLGQDQNILGYYKLEIKLVSNDAAHADAEAPAHGIVSVDTYKNRNGPNTSRPPGWYLLPGVDVHWTACRVRGEARAAAHEMSWSIYEGSASTLSYTHQNSSD
jgi:hypothetical protein